MHTAKTAERLIIVEKVHDTRMLLQGRGDQHKQLPACSQPRQTSFEVWTERVQPRPGQKSVLKRRFAEAAQQRTPVVVRTEGMIGKQIFVVLPPVRQLSLESRHCLVGPCPVAKQAS